MCLTLPVKPGKRPREVDSLEPGHTALECHGQAMEPRLLCPALVHLLPDLSNNPRRLGVHGGH